jgi:hypothetical protein
MAPRQSSYTSQDDYGTVPYTPYEQQLSQYSQAPVTSAPLHHSPLRPQLPPVSRSSEDRRRLQPVVTSSAVQCQLPLSTPSYPNTPELAFPPSNTSFTSDYLASPYIPEPAFQHASAPPPSQPTIAYNDPVLAEAFALHDSFSTQQLDPYLDEAFFSSLPVPPDPVPAPKTYSTFTLPDYPPSHDLDFSLFTQPSPPITADPSPPLSLPPATSSTGLSQPRTPYHSPPTQLSGIYPPPRDSPVRPGSGPEDVEEEERVVAIGAIKRALNKTLEAAPLPYYPARTKQSGFSAQVSPTLPGKTSRTAKLVEVSLHCWTCTSFFPPSPSLNSH